MWPAATVLAKGGAELLAATAHTLAGPAQITILADNNPGVLIIGDATGPGLGLGVCMSVVYEKGDPGHPLLVGLVAHDQSYIDARLLTPGESVALCGADVRGAGFVCPTTAAKDCTLTFRVDAW